jgi:hypothetical protein
MNKDEFSLSQLFVKSSPRCSKFITSNPYAQSLQTSLKFKLLV